MTVYRAPIPREAIVSVTNRCDARCEMCNIWQLPRDELLSAEDYRRTLPNTLTNVNLTGGEALLRSDIVEVSQAIYEASGRARIILATNGFRTDRTIETIRRIRRYIPKLGVAVSIDGCEGTHDRMRGARGAYKRAVATLEALHSIGIRDLRIGFTATSQNADELVSVYELSQSLGVEFAATIAQNSEIYYSTNTNRSVPPNVVEKNFGHLIARRLRSWSVKNWIRAYFDSGVIHFARTGERRTQCDAASGFFYLAPTGDLYPCLTLPTAIGNVREHPFQELWYGERAQKIRDEVSRCRRCWMVCTSRTQIKRHPVAITSWLLEQHGVALKRRAIRGGTTKAAETN